jgi:thiamine biosynthesis lipoprotein ApbE
VAEDPGLADAVSTALLVLGPEAGLRWARKRQDLAVLFLIPRQGKLDRRWNTAMQKFLVTDSPLRQGV